MKSLILIIVIAISNTFATEDKICYTTKSISCSKDSCIENVYMKNMKIKYGHRVDAKGIPYYYYERWVYTYSDNVTVTFMNELGKQWTYIHPKADVTLKVDNKGNFVETEFMDNEVDTRWGQCYNQSPQ